MNSSESLVDTKKKKKVAGGNVIDKAAVWAGQRFHEFLETFEDHTGKKVYIEKIRSMLDKHQCTLAVDFNDLVKYSAASGKVAELANFIEQNILRVELELRKALQELSRKELLTRTGRAMDEAGEADQEEQPPEYWVSFHGLQSIHRIRELKTHLIGSLVSISGTVTRTSEVRPELLFGTFNCLDCRMLFPNLEQQFKYTEPIACKNPMCSNRNRWQLNVETSKFVDWQRVRVQENPNEIPSGSMPRSLDIIMRNEIVEKAKPGDQCIFTGTLIVVPDVSQLALPGVKAQAVSQVGAKGEGGSNGMGENEEGFTGIKGLGVRDLTYKLCFLANSASPAHTRFGAVSARSDGDEADTTESFSLEEMEEINRMRQDTNLYKNLVQSFAPSVFGHEEVKRGILLMLFGGVHKTTHEGIELRGDINVCIVGDPSTSKSQFLKYVVSFLPRTIYTSGKASSAAGLTACVAKDPDSGEFSIEAGALMLADNGICCIDEFDKMDPRDQVAIHEAMEQQTISISKAGIQATLNARTSILAAANPIGGRYDKTKTLKANLTLSAPIMSRFDLFFIVLDECDEDTDYTIAKHIINVHQKKAEALDPVYNTLQMQRYIKFARTINPVLTPAAADKLVNHYTKLRENDVGSRGQTAYRMTVRQLESLIRLSEALARMHCDDEIREEYIDEAARLLRKSLIHVETDDVVLGDVPARRQKKMKTDGEKEEDMEKAASEEDASAGQNKKQGPTTTISYEKYMSISNMLVTYLRSLESGDIDEEAEPTLSNLKEKDLVNWYLKEVAEGLDTEEQLENESKIITRVITRLITKDCILVKQADGSIMVHPNYTLPFE